MSRQEDMIRRIIEEELVDIRERFMDAPQDELPMSVNVNASLNGFGLEGIKAEVLSLENLIRSILPKLEPEEEDNEQDDPVLNDLLQNPPSDEDFPEREDDWAERVAERIRRKLKPHPKLDALGNALKGTAKALWFLFSSTAETVEEALKNFLLGLKLWNMMNMMRKANQNILKLEHELTRIEANQGDEKDKLVHILGFMNDCGTYIHEIDERTKKIEGGLSSLNPTRQADQTLEMTQRLKVLQSDIDDIRGLLRQATLGTRYMS